VILTIWTFFFSAFFFSPFSKSSLSSESDESLLSLNLPDLLIYVSLCMKVLILSNHGANLLIWEDLPYNPTDLEFFGGKFNLVAFNIASF
jgi:hypothetical protein